MVPTEMTEVLVVEACGRMGEFAVVGLEIGVKGSIMMLDPEEIVEEENEEGEERREAEEDRDEVGNDEELTDGRLKGVVIGTMTIVVVAVAVVVFAVTVEVTVLTTGVLSACAVNVGLIGPTVVVVVVVRLTGTCEV